jgi:hypothetical protein
MHNCFLYILSKKFKDYAWQAIMVKKSKIGLELSGTVIVNINTY